MADEQQYKSYPHGYSYPPHLYPPVPPPGQYPQYPYPPYAPQWQSPPYPGFYPPAPPTAPIPETPETPETPTTPETLVTAEAPKIIKAYYWCPVQQGRRLPPTAVKGGTDTDGSEIYVGRAHHNGDLIPAKVIPDKDAAYIAYAGGEHVVDDYEVLCEQRFDWVPAQGSGIPPGAVHGGNTSGGETLYVGRVWHEGAHTVGKVHPSHGCCYIPFNGEELSFPEYEILVLRN